MLFSIYVLTAHADIMRLEIRRVEIKMQLFVSVILANQHNNMNSLALPLELCYHDGSRKGLLPREVGR